MKRYLVKETSVATENNKNFRGQTQVNYYGKGDRSIAAIYIQEPSMVSNRNYLVREYGYKRKCDAERNWTYKNPLNSEYWKSTVEIIEIEV